jgi:hypothetical protein
MVFDVTNAMLNAIHYATRFHAEHERGYIMRLVGYDWGAGTALVKGTGAVDWVKTTDGKLIWADRPQVWINGTDLMLLIALQPVKCEWQGDYVVFTRKDGGIFKIKSRKS